MKQQRTPKATASHMRSRLADLAFLSGQRSEKSTRQWLKDNGYTDDPGDSAIEYACDHGHEYGLWLSAMIPHQPEEDDTDRKIGFDPYDDSTFSKSVWRVPAIYRHFSIWDFNLSTGGPEDGFLIVANPNGQPVAGYYYEADWGTFARRRLTANQLATVAAFLMLEDYA